MAWLASHTRMTRDSPSEVTQSFTTGGPAVPNRREAWTCVGDDLAGHQGSRVGKIGEAPLVSD